MRPRLNHLLAVLATTYAKSITHEINKDTFLTVFTLPKNGSNKAEYFEDSGILRLTTNDKNRVGNAVMVNQADFTKPLTFTGTVEFGYKQLFNDIADGLSFGFHTGLPTATGEKGEGLGAAGLPNFVGWKIDTFKNASDSHSWRTGQAVLSQFITTNQSGKVSPVSCNSSVCLISGDKDMKAANNSKFTFSYDPPEEGETEGCLTYVLNTKHTDKYCFIPQANKGYSFQLAASTGGSKALQQITVDELKYEEFIIDAGVRTLVFRLQHPPIPLYGYSGSWSDIFSFTHSEGSILEDAGETGYTQGVIGNLEAIYKIAGTGTISLAPIMAGRKHMIGYKVEYDQDNIPQAKETITSSGDSSNPIDERIVVEWDHEKTNEDNTLLATARLTLLPLTTGVTLDFGSTQVTDDMLKGIKYEFSDSGIKSSHTAFEKSGSGSYWSVLTGSEEIFVVGQQEFYIEIPLFNNAFTVKFECQLDPAKLTSAYCSPSTETLKMYPDARSWMTTSVSMPSGASVKRFSLTLKMSLNLPVGYYASRQTIDISQAPSLLNVGGISAHSGYGNRTFDMTMDGDIYEITAYSPSMPHPSSGNNVRLGYKIPLNAEPSNAFIIPNITLLKTEDNFDTGFILQYNNDSCENSQPVYGQKCSHYTTAAYDIKDAFSPKVDVSSLMTFDESINAITAVSHFKPTVKTFYSLEMTLNYDYTMLGDLDSPSVGISYGHYTTNVEYGKGTITFVIEADIDQRTEGKISLPLKGTDYVVDFEYCTMKSDTLSFTNLKNSADPKTFVCTISATVDATKTPQGLYRMVLDVDYSDWLAKTNTGLTVTFDNSTSFIQNNKTDESSPVGRSLDPRESSNVSLVTTERKNLSSIRSMPPIDSIDVETGDELLMQNNPPVTESNEIGDSSQSETAKVVGLNLSATDNLFDDDVEKATPRALAAATGFIRYDLGNKVGSDSISPSISFKSSGYTAKAILDYAKCDATSMTPGSNVSMETYNESLDDRTCYIFISLIAYSTANRPPHMNVEFAYPGIGHRVASINISTTGNTQIMTDLTGASLQTVELYKFYVVANDPKSTELTTIATVYFTDSSYVQYTLVADNKNSCTDSVQFSKYFSAGFDGQVSNDVEGHTSSRCNYHILMSFDSGPLTTVAPETSGLPPIPTEEPAKTSTTHPPNPPSIINNDKVVLTGDLMANKSDGFNFIDSSTDPDLEPGVGIDTAYTFTIDDTLRPSNVTKFYGTFGKTPVSMSASPFTCTADGDTTFLPEDISLELGWDGSTSSSTLNCAVKARFNAKTIAAADYRLKGNVDMKAIINNVLDHTEHVVGSGNVATTNAGITGFNLSNKRSTPITSFAQTIVLTGGIAHLDIVLTADSCTIAQRSMPSGYEIETDLGSYKAGDLTCSANVIFKPVVPFDGAYSLIVTYEQDPSFVALYGENVTTLTGERRDYIVPREGSIHEYDISEVGDVVTQRIVAYNNNKTSEIEIVKVVDTTFGLIEATAIFDGNTCTASVSENVWIKSDYDASRSTSTCVIRLGLSSMGKKAGLTATIAWDEITETVISAKSIGSTHLELGVPIQKEQKFEISAIAEPSAESSTMLIPILINQYPGTVATLSIRMTFEADRVYCHHELIDLKLPEDISRDGKEVPPITLELMNESTKFTCKPSVYVEGIPKTVNAGMIAGITAAAVAVAAGGAGYYIYEATRYRTFETEFDRPDGGDIDDDVMEANVEINDSAFA